MDRSLILTAEVDVATDPGRKVRRAQILDRRVRYTEDAVARPTSPAVAT